MDDISVVYILAATILVGVAGVRCETRLLVSISPGPTARLNDVVSVRCRVVSPEAGLFINWMKRQGDDVVEMGTNTFLNDDVPARYSVEVQFDDAATIDFVLTIHGVEYEDGGEIGCLLPLTSSSMILQPLVVAVPSQHLQLFALDDVTSHPVYEYHNGEVVTFHKGDRLRFKCRSTASYPSPRFLITLHGEDITEYFQMKSSCYVVGGVSRPGFRQWLCDAEMSTQDPVVIDYQQNALEFRCTVHITGEEPVAVHILPKLQFRPVISCDDDIRVPLYSRDVTIRCLVRADPRVTELAWHWSQSTRNFSMHPGQRHYSRYLVKPLEVGPTPDSVMAKLLLVGVTHKFMYHDYVITASNSLGDARHVVTLYRDFTAEAEAATMDDSKGNASSPPPNHLSLVLTPLLLLISSTLH